MSVSPSAGTGSNSVTVTFSKNLSGSNRTGMLFFKDNTQTATTSIDVTQLSVTIPEITPRSLAFAASGGTDTFTITDNENVGWHFGNIPSWLTLSQTGGTGSTTVNITVAANTSSSSKIHNLTFYAGTAAESIGITQEAGSSTFNCLLNFTYGDVTAPQTATWDEYNIYYNITGGNPVEDEKLMMSISCGTILYQGTTWNPTISSYYSVSSPFVDAGSVSQIEVPQSLAGQTIYLKVEFGSAEAGYAIYSELVTVQIPSSGGTVNVTIPKF